MWSPLLGCSAVLLAALSWSVAVRAAPGAPPNSSPAATLSGLGINTVGTIPLGNAQFTCGILQRAFPTNETFTSASPLFDALFEESWSRNCRLEPSCVITPNTAADVSVIIRILNALKTKFAVRSGGHVAVPGFSSIGNNGVLIALEKLNKLALSSDKQIATVGPGNRWRDVYQFAGTQGVTVLGGRTIVVGVGGFLLGGGLSAFYNTYGLGLDSITRYQVVLPNGTIVDATQRKNADLYKGLKGGMANFGIVTEFDIQTNTQTDIYYEVAFYSPANTPALLEAYASYLNNADPNSNVEIQISPDRTLAFFGYLGHVDRPATFDIFSSVPADLVPFPPTNGTLNQLLFTIGDAGLTSDGSTYGGTLSFKIPDSRFLIESYKAYINASASVPPGVSLTYVPQGVTPNLVTQGRTRNGGNLLGLEATPQVWADIFAQIPNVSDEPASFKILDDLLANLISGATSAGVKLAYLYPNNAAGYQKPLHSFGDKNLQFIKTVAAKYDPQGVMQKLQNDGFLLSQE